MIYIFDACNILGESLGGFDAHDELLGGEVALDLVEEVTAAPNRREINPCAGEGARGRVRGLGVDLRSGRGFGELALGGLGGATETEDIKMRGWTQAGGSTQQQGGGWSHKIMVPESAGPQGLG